MSIRKVLAAEETIHGPTLGREQRPEALLDGKDAIEEQLDIPANVLCDAADTEALSMSRDAGAASQAGEPASWSIRGAQPSAEEANFPHAGLGGGDGEGGSPVE
mmetsp:Transcript_11611/g.30848  ORF Transcript_11611/g.30848 Transcript_11611/m.30848 type:complete len:104 (+) Transcript_11611:345-656(+)